MKPIVNKDSVYERFLAVNSWVFEIFPNAKEVVSIKYKVLSIKKKKSLNTCYLILNTFFNKIEQSLKVFQLHLINRHRTTEIITSTQLWFHPNDFYKRIYGLTQKKDESTRIKTDKKRKNKASQKI
jgi:F0F1-type ATP synthase gamma subunit